MGLIDRKDDGKSRSLVRVWEGGRTMASIGCSSFTMVCMYVCASGRANSIELNRYRYTNDSNPGAALHLCYAVTLLRCCLRAVRSGTIRWIGYALGRRTFFCAAAQLG